MTKTGVLAAVIFGGLAASICLAEGDELRLTASAWPPYVDVDAERNGFAVVLVSQALERAGYETSFTVTSWPESLENTEAGSFDVNVSLWRTDERAEALTFSEPYITNDISFVKRAASDINFSDRGDLVGLRIGVGEDFAYTAERYDTAGIDVQVGGSVDENIGKLKAEELDLVISDRRVALYEINALGLAKSFEVMPNPLLTRGLRIAVSKQHPDHAGIIDAFEAAVAEMRKDGSFNAILATFRVSE